MLKIDRFFYENIPVSTADFVRARETPDVVRQAARSHRALAELKGAVSIPNETILIDTLALQEAKDSSATESIITQTMIFFRETFFQDNSQALRPKKFTITRLP